MNGMIVDWSYSEKNSIIEKRRRNLVVSAFAVGAVAIAGVFGFSRVAHSAPVGPAVFVPQNTAPTRPLLSKTVARMIADSAKPQMGE